MNQDESRDDDSVFRKYRETFVALGVGAVCVLLAVLVAYGTGTTTQPPSVDSGPSVESGSSDDSDSEKDSEKDSETDSDDENDSDDESDSDSDS